MFPITSQETFILMNIFLLQRNKLQGRRFKCEGLRRTTDGRTDDGHQVMLKAHSHDLWLVELIHSCICCKAGQKSSPKARLLRVSKSRTYTNICYIFGHYNMRA